VSVHARSTVGLPFQAERRKPRSPSADVVRSPGQTGHGVPHCLLAFRLAWRQLRSEPARLLAAVTGVMFATILVLMQLGFRGALFVTAAALPQALHAELFLLNPLTMALFRAEPVPRVRGFQALSVPEVEKAVPIYLAQSFWRNPENGTHRAIQLIGFDAEDGAVNIAGLAPLVPLLKRADAVAFDALARPEFGHITDLLARKSTLNVQIGSHEVQVVGTVRLGASFSADGSAVMNETTFRRIIPATPVSDASVIALRLKPGADPVSIRAELTRLLPPDVAVLTHAQLVQREHEYWDATTPIGVIFAFGSLLGIVVGMVIVYQILFTDIASHLREYATLKAMGYRNLYLSQVVISEAVILAGLGFIPGALASAVLYHYASGATYLDLDLTGQRCATVFCMILGMCVSAALLTLRKLRQAEPAEVF
jgi:putative ABC transport system permease protein